MKFYSDDDLKDILAELSTDEFDDSDTYVDEELIASQRRYEEIVKKYKN